MPCSSHPRKGGISHENYVIVSATSLSNMPHTRCPTLVNEVMEFILFVLSYAKPEILAEIHKCVVPKEIQWLHGLAQNHNYKLCKK
jgi:hypothetical protein